MTTRRLVEIDITDRADGKVPAWDAGSGTHVYADPTTAAPLVIPTFVAVGTPVSGTGDVVVPLPAGHTTNDMLYVAVHSNNQTAAAPAGYTKFGPACGIGVAGAAGGARLTVFKKRDGGSETDPTVLDTGDHTYAVAFAIRGGPTSGDAEVSVGQIRKVVASVTGAGHAGSTHVESCLVVTIFAHALDSAAAVFSSPVNADLGSVTEQFDGGTTDGNGGGIGIITGTKAAAGAFAATTTTETSTADVSFTFYVIPDGASTAGAVSRMVVFTAALGDVIAKPDGVKDVAFAGVGGAASGSAGRNAATAAGGGGGGGGMWAGERMGAAALPATITVTAGAGGAATANTDSAVSNAGAVSNVVAAGITLFAASGGSAAGVSATGSGGVGGNGGGISAAGIGAGVASFASQSSGGGTGGTTAQAGGGGFDWAGGAGAGGGTSQATSAGGLSWRGGGGGGGGRSNTNVGTGGASNRNTLAGGASAGANGADSPYPEYGGSGAAGGTSAVAAGTGGWPGGGGGGGGTGSGTQGGGKGGDGAITVTWFL